MYPLLVKQCNSWVFDTGSIGMIVIRRNLIQELQWPKRLEKNMVTMHIENKNKRLLCSPLASYLVIEISCKELSKLLHSSGFMRAMVVRLKTMLHSGWIIYYKS